MGFSANQLRVGMIIEYEGVLWQCLSAEHRTPGNKRAFMQAKMRNVLEGHQKEFRFSATETLERATLKEKSMQFLYADGDLFHFMDTTNYEQIQIGRDQMGNTTSYLLPETQVEISFYDERPIGVRLPQSMTFKVIEAEPNMKSATATSSFKNAKIETGLPVKVPQFVEEGDSIIISTETGDYLERATK